MIKMMFLMVVAIISIPKPVSLESVHQIGSTVVVVKNGTTIYCATLKDEYNEKDHFDSDNDLPCSTNCQRLTCVKIEENDENEKYKGMLKCWDIDERNSALNNAMIFAFLSTILFLMCLKLKLLLDLLDEC